MSKNKYDIPEKADFIRLTILLHDLVCYDKALQEPISDKESLVQKFRNTRNVFVSLHNLRDTLNVVQVDWDREFISKTRALRRELEFIGHVRNKGVGHLDKELLERAAQWMPQIFYESSKDNEEYITFECYRAVLEASINSYLNELGEQKIFSSDIDLLYPPNAKRFFEFLSRTVNDSISWLSEAREKVKSKIDFHSRDQIKELGAIAGQTSFDLKGESNLDFSEEETKERLVLALDKLRGIGAEEKVIDFIKKEFMEEYNK
ncbi:hypothetical protein [Nitrosomonas sp. Is37]|uniref:hypothetical protein n=1 Tax=Nitrosomonas sp. Is37 TaxID=3080535 RepID=UPI00294B538C|nr:hypothetical protein [Nitrosomonas sp. Is37]MDV6345032.1 hypothetical protein [Nitrosomonas sp. Is37]